MLDLLIMLGVWGGAAISVVSAVLSASYARKNVSKQLRDDVDEIVAAVGSLGKVVRSVQMQRVRGASAAPGPIEAPPVDTSDKRAIKTNLRAQLAQMRRP